MHRHLSLNNVLLSIKWRLWLCFVFYGKMKSEALQIADIIDILSIISPLPDEAEAMQIL